MRSRNKLSDTTVHSHIYQRFHKLDTEEAKIKKEKEELFKIIEEARSTRNTKAPRLTVGRFANSPLKTRAHDKLPILPSPRGRDKVS